jgi:ribosomal protein S18 acetylase RimI-like enzyme
VDALTPAPFVARLALEGGFRVTDDLVMCLEGELLAKPGNCDIREVLAEEQWQAYADLDAMWWKETSTGALGPYDPQLHLGQFMRSKRAKVPAVRSWMAYVDGEPRAFFSSWPGEDGFGQVEDLYCHPEFRHRGLATALIAHCVADARARGARAVLITADPHDTPKRMYNAMGFRPLYLSRSYLKIVAPVT